VFGPILGGKLLFLLRVANKALRLRSLVFLAPVAFLLALCRNLGAALAADFFGDAVLGTPPAAVVLAGRLHFRVHALALGLSVPTISSPILIVGLAAAYDCETDGGKRQESDIETY